MKPILYESSETEFKSMGIGALVDATNGRCTEERNGMFEVQFEYPVNGALYSELEEYKIVVVKPYELGDYEPFDIYRITKPHNNLVTVYARHISYRLNGIPVRPFQTIGIDDALSHLVDYSVLDNPFTMWTDISDSTGVFTVQQVTPFRNLLGGMQGSILDTFGNGAEYEWNKFTVKFWNRRGSDKNVVIRYGKNLIDLEQEKNIENVYTGVQATYLNEEVGTSIYSDIQFIENHEDYPRENIFVLDATGDFEDEPTVEELNARALAYATNNDIGIPETNLKVQFQQLWNTKEYANVAPLERVNLCDTVTIYHEKLGVEAKAKVIRTVYDFINERYTEIEVGDAKSSLSETLAKSISETETFKTAISVYEQAVANLGELVANGFGLFETNVVQADGSVKRYYHNRPSLEESTVVWAFVDGAFSVSQDGGQTWSAGITSDGEAVVNILEAVGINANWIKAGMIDTDLIIFADGRTLTETLEGIRASIYDNEQQQEQAWAELSSIGLRIGTPALNETITTVTGDGLDITAPDGTVIANFSSVESMVNYLRVLEHLSFGAHRAEMLSKQEMSDELAKNSTKTEGTAFLWVGDIV